MMQSPARSKISNIGGVAIAIAIMIPMSFALGASDNRSAMDIARDAVKTSVKALVDAKDDTSVSNVDREINKLAAAKETVKKVIAIGLAEVETLTKKLDGLEIEKLVTDDYTFDAEKIHDEFASIFVESRAYYRSAGKAIDRAGTLTETQDIAAQIEKWRHESYNPVVQRLFAIDLVLRQRTIVAMGNNRFEKILNDIRKLKNAKLITIESFDVLLRRATADQKIANSLNTDATNLLLAELRDARTSIDTRRIIALIEQSFTRIKNMYKQFLEINKLVKEMIGGTK